MALSKVATSKPGVVQNVALSKIATSRPGVGQNVALPRWPRVSVV